VDDHTEIQLPTISANAAIINGYSQPGASKNTLAQGDNAKLAVAINGTKIQSISPGFLIDQPGTQIFGLDIENFGQLGQGVVIRSATNVQIAGCFIGVDPTGETAAPDGIGVEIFNSSNTIGGPNVGDRNVISGNLSDAIYLPDKSSNPLQITQTGNVTENNYIGLDAAGNKAITNHGYGVDDFGSGNTYGGTAPGTGNVISGNFYGGINNEGSIAVEGNYIGTDATGHVALGNGTPGTAVGDFVPSGATSITTTITDNVISGDVDGIYVSIGTVSQSTCTISNNKIGTDVTGTAAIGNIGTGLVVGSANKIGVLISGGNTSSVANDVLQGNFIGTDKTGLVSLGNSEDGVEVNGSDVTLGGGGPGQANVIAHNGGYGIYLLTGQQDKFSQNSIFGNSNSGIHENIFTNNSISPPVLTFTPGTGSSGTLSGTLTELANTTYVVEVFSSSAAPTTGQEQGQTFVKAVSVTTDGSGKGTFSLTEPNAFYTATVTDPTGDTSPFSNATGSQSTLPASTTDLSSSLNPSTVGQPVTFTAVVAAPGFQGTPTGTVTFTIDGQAQPPVSLAVVGGKDEAQFITNSLAAGQHSVTAAYSGDPSVSPSSGSLSTQTVDARGLQQTTTTVTSSANPSTVGQQVTFTAIVSSAASATATGTVTFTIDGTPQAPVPVVLVDGRDEVVFAISTLSAGRHTVDAVYNGDTTFAASPVSNIVTQTVDALPPAVDPPDVVSVERFGIHMQPTVLLVTFGSPLDPARAQDVHNYGIVSPCGRKISIDSAVYNSTAHTVTLRPHRRFNFHRNFRFTIFGTSRGGVANPAGIPLDGLGNGKPGSNYVTILNRSELVVPSSPAKKQVRAKPIQPSAALHHQFLSRSR
jgi:hypothetical protein